MSAIVIARGVSHEFANGRELFHDLNVSLDASFTALVGSNGVGKTSLARILAGELVPSRGAVQRHGAVRYFAQRELPEPITVAEYLAADYEWSLPAQRLLDAVDFGSLCTHLSGGQWMRVRLARALADDFLILDEPSNDLDRDGRDALWGFLRERTRGALLISHDVECLGLCNDVLELSNQGLMRFGGDWDAYLLAREHERERLHSALTQAKRERTAARVHAIEQKARQDKRNRRGAAAAARGGAPKLLVNARKRKAQVSTGKLDTALLEKTEAVVRDAHTAFSELKLDPVMYADVAGRELPAQKLVAAAHGFNVRFNGRSADWLYARDLDFDWRGNVRIAIHGPNGSGKSTLLRAIGGATFTTRGELRRGELATLYVDQRCSVLDDAASVIENVQAVSSAGESEIRTALSRFLFAGDAVFQKAHSLSGGERLRAALARGFLATQRPELLLLDEPTNNLDLANVRFLAGVARTFRGALVVVSHDRAFVESCGFEDELILPRRAYL